MAGPSTTDWITAWSSVVQTVGALSAIGVTAWIASRTERESARRERESVERENAARIAADERAERAIQKAADADKQRLLDARRRIATIALHGIDLTLSSFEEQAGAIDTNNSRDEAGDIVTVKLDWITAETTMTTLQALSQRTDDPMLATLLEQCKDILQRPDALSNWWPEGAQRELTSRTRQLRHLRDAIEAA